MADGRLGSQRQAGSNGLLRLGLPLQIHEQQTLCKVGIAGGRIKIDCTIQQCHRTLPLSRTG
ncbi:MAG: hypothetical protein EWM73_02633 [Nitrospira sp.]|nr:MAG: hypothetical protein EWM73_02633 [Nitrospira sp.]